MKKRLIFSFLLLMTLCLTFAAASFAEGTEGSDMQYTVSFEMNGAPWPLMPCSTDTWL